MTQSSSITPIWNAQHLPNTSANGARLSPFAVDSRWQALTQPWRKEDTEPGFHLGWARISWSKASLCYEAIFLGSQQHNRAQQLNERTWELGDVCEIFLHVSGQPVYLELHVTPENQRLQLIWSVDGLDRVRRGETQLEDFLIAREDWVESSTHVGPGFWVSRVVIPADRFGIDSLTPQLALQTSVSRYDYGSNHLPVLSTTAPLKFPCFHRRQEWSQLVLSTAP